MSPSTEHEERLGALEEAVEAIVHLLDVTPTSNKYLSRPFLLAAGSFLSSVSAGLTGIIPPEWGIGLAVVSAIGYGLVHAFDINK